MYTKKWFTVVELLVAVLIVAVLAVVWFIQFTVFLSTSRDANRISQVAEIYDGFVGLEIRWTLPLPTDYIEIIKWDKLITYQWHVWERILHQMEFSGRWKDPETDEYFSYSLTRNKKSISIMTFLEDDPVLKNYVTQNEVYANEYKYPYIEWEKVGIILDNTNNPVDRLEAYKKTWEFDLQSTDTQLYKLYLANDEDFIWTKNNLINISKDYSCKRIRDLDPSTQNGIFPLDTDGDGILESNYCNMQIEGWGWTLVMKADGDNQTFEYDSLYWENTDTYNPDDYKYDELEYKNEQFSSLGFQQVMLELKTDNNTRYIIAAIDWESLQEIFAWEYTQTYLTREIWKTIIEDSSLQFLCNKEWFNVTADNENDSDIKTRFWIISNQENQCDTPDSRIWIWSNWRDNFSVWNYADYEPDNGFKSTSSFWYLYVR